MYSTHTTDNHIFGRKMNIKKGSIRMWVSPILQTMVHVQEEIY